MFVGNFETDQLNINKKVLFYKPGELLPIFWLGKHFSGTGFLDKRAEILCDLEPAGQSLLDCPTCPGNEGTASLGL